MKEKKEVKQDEPIFHDEGAFDLNLKDKIRLTGHRWKQQGPTLICDSCTLRHGAYIGMEYMLIGIDTDGRPKFRRRS